MYTQKTDPAIDDQIAVDNLKANCRFSTKEEMRLEFSEKEVAQMKKDFFEKKNNEVKRNNIWKTIKESLELDGSMAELIEVFEEQQEKLIGTVGTKLLKKESKELMQKINDGFHWEERKLFAFDYQEIGRMAFYDEYGLFVYDRNIKPEEKQISIHSNIKNIANG